MKILLYTESEKLLKNSGLGNAINHQMQALCKNNIEYTKNKKDDFDIVHINWYGVGSYRFAKKAKKMGKKVVYHAHSTEEDFRNSFIFSNLVSPLFKRWLIKCYRTGDAIITPTPYSKRLLEGYGLSNIYAVSNGVDTSFFTRNEAAGLDFRKKYGFSQNDKVIMAIGLYIERKGILDFAELAKRCPEYKFIWFGYTDLRLVPKKIRKAVENPPENLIFAGFVQPKEICAALSGADLFLFPTLEETEGIPALEAASAKAPSLIRNIPVFEGWLEDEVNVHMAKTVDEFEDKIKKILSKKLPDLTDAAYKIAKERDIDKVGQELIGVYNSLL